MIILLTIVSSEFIERSTNQQGVKKKFKCTGKNKSFELNVTLVRLGLLCTSHLKPPHLPHSGLSGAFTFYASESEWSPRFPGTKVSGTFQHMVLPL